MNRKLFRCFLGLAIATIIILIWCTRSSTKPSNVCPYDRESQHKIVKLAHRVHHILAELLLTHCLCYGALWATLQKGDILPWEGDVKFCVLNQELLRFEENFLIHHFRDRKLLMSYNSGEGYFSITNMSSFDDMDVKLMIFEALDGDMMRRIGWIRRVLPPNCDMTPSLECFPSRLIMNPLPETRFDTESLPVPREGIEMLKYQYPDSWWLDIIPLYCR